MCIKSWIFCINTVKLKDRHMIGTKEIWSLIVEHMQCLYLNYVGNMEISGLCSCVKCGLCKQMVFYIYYIKVVFRAGSFQIPTVITVLKNCICHICHMWTGTCFWLWNNCIFCGFFFFFCIYVHTTDAHVHFMSFSCKYIFIYFVMISYLDK